MRTSTRITGRHAASDVRLKCHENIGRLLTNIFTADTFIMLDKIIESIEV